MKHGAKFSCVRQAEITLNDFFKLPYYIARGIRYHASGSIYTPKPRSLAFLVTRKCDSRCIMCSIWKTANVKKEMSVEEIKTIVGNPLFNTLKTVILSGGEATQRKDLLDVVKVILHVNPHIKELVLNTNGFEPNLITQTIEGIFAQSVFNRLSNFLVIVSLDGYGITHEKIRRVPNAFEKVCNTLNQLKNLQHMVPFNIRLTCVVQPANIHELPKLIEFASEQKVSINFVPCITGSLVNNFDSKDTLTLSNDQLDLLESFWEQASLYGLSLSSRAFWRDYFHIIRGSKRRVPCALVYHAVAMDADGTLFICGKDESLVYGNAKDHSAEELWYSDRAKEVRKLATQSVCPHCDVSCNVDFAFSQEFFFFTQFFIKEKLWSKMSKRYGHRK